MATREDRVLSDVATAIGSTLGAVVAQTDKIKRFVRAEEKAVAKKVRGVRSRAVAVKRRTKTVVKKAKRAISTGKRKAKSASKRTLKRTVRRRSSSR
ncbi:MAG: hypothetical protein WA871_08060 [Candidatus Acidiferrales bacterium]